MIKVELIDHMGSDVSIVNGARVSFDTYREGDLLDRDERLIKFLARESHFTPFRHTGITLRCEAPIAIARQLGKHQAGMSWNEMSRRYKDGDVECFIPDQFFSRPDDLHSGSGGPVDVDSEYHKSLLAVFNAAYQGAVGAYKGMLKAGLAPEQARFLLPQGMMTKWIWTGNLLSFFNMYKQRINPHAQYEARLFAEQVDEVLSKLYPISWKALKDANISTDDSVNEEVQAV